MGLNGSLPRAMTLLAIKRGGAGSAGDEAARLWPAQEVHTNQESVCQGLPSDGRGHTARLGPAHHTERERERERERVNEKKNSVN